MPKHNYLVVKERGCDEPGGLYKAYQLTSPVAGFNGMNYQNGFIFYIPAWKTSKIDPVTGFAASVRPVYQSRQEAVEFWNCFDRISYNPAKGYFEFEKYKIMR